MNAQWRAVLLLANLKRAFRQPATLLDKHPPYGGNLGPVKLAVLLGPGSGAGKEGGFINVGLLPGLKEEQER